MGKLKIARMIAVLAGAAVLFWLRQGLGVSFYVAVPAAVVVYMALKLAIGLAWGVDERA